MADEATPAAPTLEAVDNDTSNAPVELTPTQAASKSFTADLDAEIDALWAKGAAGAPIDEPLDVETDPEPEPVKAKAETVTAPPKADAPKTEEPPVPEIDRESIERDVRAKWDAEQQVKADAERRVRDEAESRSQYESYIGPESEYNAVSAALRAAQRGDTSLLADLDVVLPNGKKVSQVKPDGLPGLNAAEAASLLDTWDQNRAYEEVMGTRKVAQILGYWDQQTQAALTDPDVDAAKVRSFRTPGEQMKAAIETTRATVEKRKDAERAASDKVKDAEIERLTQRATSLTNERANLTSQQRAATAATADRPGQPAAARRDLPDPDELSRMSADEAFKGGHIERLLHSIPGGMSSRRTG